MRKNTEPRQRLDRKTVDEVVLDLKTELPALKRPQSQPELVPRHATAVDHDLVRPVRLPVPLQTANDLVACQTHVPSAPRSK